MIVWADGGRKGGIKTMIGGLGIENRNPSVVWALEISCACHHCLALALGNFILWSGCRLVQRTQFNREGNKFLATLRDNFSGCFIQLRSIKCSPYLESICNSRWFWWWTSSWRALTIWTYRGIQMIKRPGIIPMSSNLQGKLSCPKKDVVLSEDGVLAEVLAGSCGVCCIDRRRNVSFSSRLFTP